MRLYLHGAEVAWENQEASLYREREDSLRENRVTFPEHSESPNRNNLGIVSAHSPGKLYELVRR